MSIFKTKPTLLALLALLAVAGLLGVGTHALFTDSQANTGNSVDSGELTAPSLSQPTPSGGSVPLSWTATTLPGNSSLENEITYKVERKLGAGSYGAADGTCTGNLSGTSCTDSVSSSGTYTYRVVAQFRTWTRDSNERTVAVTVGTPVVTPAAPTSVALANGGGVGDAYINDANKANLSVTVGLPASSLPINTVHVTITDGTNTTTDQTAPATTGAGSVTVTGINASSLNDGSVTIRATSSNAGGTSPETTTSVTKDTVKPVASVGTITNITSGNTFTVPYSASDTSPSSTLDKAELYVDPPGGDASFSLTNTDSSPSASGESFAYTGATADGTYRFYALAHDKAGNVEDTPADPEKTATRTTLPTINRAVLIKSEQLPNGTAGQIRQNAGYAAYADVTPAPGATISSVTANLSSVSGPGSASVSLSACSPTCTVNGLTYSHRVTGRTSSNLLAAGLKGFAITATDNLGRSATRGDTTTSSALTVNVDNTRPQISSVSTTGDDDGQPEQGETIKFTYDSPIDGISLFSGWQWPFGDMNVRVAFIHRNNASDRLAVRAGASFATTMGFGLVELGSEAYVTGGNNDEVLFGGTGAAQNSTIARSGNEFVVTLGSQNGTTGSGALGGSPPATSDISWAGGSGTAYDAAGNVVNGTPATASSGVAAQF